MVKPIKGNNKEEKIRSTLAVKPTKPEQEPEEKAMLKKANKAEGVKTTRVIWGSKPQKPELHPEHEAMLNKAKAEGVTFGFPGKYCRRGGLPSNGCSSSRSSTSKKRDPRIDWRPIEERKKEVADEGRLRAAGYKEDIEWQKKWRKKHGYDSPPDYSSCDSDDDTLLEFMCFRHHPPHRLPDPDEDDDDDAFIPLCKKLELETPRQVLLDMEHAEDLLSAQEALAHYNENHEIKYRLTETLGCYSRVYGGAWYHCNFLAVPISNSDSDPADHPAVPELFFAEVHFVEPIKVICCCILNDPRDITHGCKGCSKKLAHPSEGYQFGHAEKRKKVGVKELGAMKVDAWKAGASKTGAWIFGAWRVYYV